MKISQGEKTDLCVLDAFKTILFIGISSQTEEKVTNLTKNSENLHFLSVQYPMETDKKREFYSNVFRNVYG